MGRKNDFPKLKALNLYAADITGNGNCLFNALSDQLYGNQSYHAKLRAATIDYMRTNASHFKSFIVVHPGGGTRRSRRIPKRKNPGTLVDTKSPTPQEVDTTFENYLKTMAKGGAYGDNLEVVAFANVFRVDICIYSEEAGAFWYCNCDDEATKTAYIVHHTWEHYSSIRNTSGPHDGLPDVIFVHSPPEVEAAMKEQLTNRSYVQSWMVEEILRFLPYITSREVVEEALQAYKGSINNAISSLMPASSQSSSRSSSIEREPDSDDEIEQKPKKRPDRRLSRPQPLRIGNSNKRLTVSIKDLNSLSPDPKQLSAALSQLKDDEQYDPDETEEEDWQNDKDSQETTSVSTSASDSSAASKGETGPTVRLKLSQPKKQVDRVQPASTAPSGQSNAGDYDADGEKPQKARLIAKPKGRLLTRDEQNAEKASPRASLSPTDAKHKKSNQSPPVIDVGIKILRI